MNIPYFFFSLLFNWYTTLHWETFSQRAHIHITFIILQKEDIEYFQTLVFFWSAGVVMVERWLKQELTPLHSPPIRTTPWESPWARGCDQSCRKLEISAGLLLCPLRGRAHAFWAGVKGKGPLRDFHVPEKPVVGVELDGKNSHPWLCPFFPTRGLENVQLIWVFISFSKYFLTCIICANLTRFSEERSLGGKTLSLLMNTFGGILNFFSFYFS